MATVESRSPESLGSVLRRIALRSFSVPPDPAARYGFAAAAEPSPPCDRCGGAGYMTRRVPVDHADFGKVFECPCQDTEERRSKRYAALLKFSELPTLNRPCFEDLRPVDGYPNLQEAVRFVEQWCEHPAGFLVITGPVGTGKTHCAVSAGYKLLGQGRVVHYATTVRLLDALRNAFRHEDEEGHYALVDRMRTVDVLILDDLGKQRDTDFAQDRLATIIDARHSARLITIVTTNLNIDELGVWDPSTASRLLDRAMSVTVPMYGPDYRRRG